MLLNKSNVYQFCVFQMSVWGKISAVFYNISLFTFHLEQLEFNVILFVFRKSYLKRDI